MTIMNPKLVGKTVIVGDLVFGLGMGGAPSKGTPVLVLDQTDEMRSKDEHYFLLVKSNNPLSADTPFKLHVYELDRDKTMESLNGLGIKYLFFDSEDEAKLGDD